MGDRDGPQHPVRAGEEDQAEVGQAVHDQLGGVLEQLVPVLRGGDQVAGLEQESDPLLAAVPSARAVRSRVSSTARSSSARRRAVRLTT